MPKVPGAKGLVRGYRDADPTGTQSGRAGALPQGAGGLPAPYLSRNLAGLAR